MRTLQEKEINRIAMEGEEVENHDENQTRPPTASGGVEAGGASGSGEGDGAQMRTRLVKTALLNASFIMLVREGKKTSMTFLTPYYFFSGFLWSFSWTYLARSAGSL